MAEAKYLDGAGLGRTWEKIKAYITNLILIDSSTPKITISCKNNENPTRIEVSPEEILIGETINSNQYMKHNPVIRFTKTGLLQMVAQNPYNGSSNRVFQMSSGSRIALIDSKADLELSTSMFTIQNSKYSLGISNLSSAKGVGYKQGNISIWFTMTNGSGVVELSFSSSATIKVVCIANVTKTATLTTSKTISGFSANIPCLVMAFCSDDGDDSDAG